MVVLPTPPFWLAIAMIRVTVSQLPGRGRVTVPNIDTRLAGLQDEMFHVEHFRILNVRTVAAKEVTCKPRFYDRVTERRSTRQPCPRPTTGCNGQQQPRSSKKGKKNQLPAKKSDQSLSPGRTGTHSCAITYSSNVILTKRPPVSRTAMGPPDARSPHRRQCGDRGKDSRRGSSRVHAGRSAGADRMIAHEVQYSPVRLRHAVHNVVRPARTHECPRPSRSKRPNDVRRKRAPIVGSNIGWLKPKRKQLGCSAPPSRGERVALQRKPLERGIRRRILPQQQIYRPRRIRFRHE